MRYALVVGLVLVVATGSASAQPAAGSQYDWRKPNTAGVFIEFGGGWQRLHPPNGFTYRSEYLRIAPQVSLNSLLYIGAAFQFGHIYSAYGAPDSAIGAIPENTYDNEGDGTSFSGQVFLGVRDLIGIVSFGGEVAPTLRRTSAGMNYAYASDNTNTTTIEFNGRADVWATPHITAGVMAGMDLQSIRDFQGGIQVGFHLEPYDAMRNRR
ncbi:MAG TPA: hypothetical protein VIV58_18510 [Kofleriaceae bacterium]